MTALKKVVTAIGNNAFEAKKMKFAFVAVLVMLTAIGGCDRRPSDGRGLLERLSNRVGPDELATVPQKPLAAPGDFSQLPEPTPGTGNRADLTPGIDVVVAMTGSAPRESASASGDALFLAQIMMRAGATPDDGFGWFGLFDGRGDLLDAQAELERLRALGIRTPAAPPTR